MNWTLVVAGMFSRPWSDSHQIAVTYAHRCRHVFTVFFHFGDLCRGRVIKWFMDRRAERQQLNEGQKTTAENTGVLIASGLIAGEALMAVLLAFLVALISFNGSDFELAGLVGWNSAWLGVIAFVAWPIFSSPCHWQKRAIRSNLRCGSGQGGKPADLQGLV
jgi:hypothetical protein